MKSKIEWCDDTINPITGCSPISEGCKNCYAAAMAKRFWGQRKFSDIQFHPERLNEFSKGKKPRRKFIGSMTDIFHKNVLTWWLNQIDSRIVSWPIHTFP
jgi:protein gp37